MLLLTDIYHRNSNETLGDIGGRMMSKTKPSNQAINYDIAYKNENEDKYFTFKGPYAI